MPSLTSSLQPSRSLLDYVDESLLPGVEMIETNEVEARVAASLKAVGVPYEVLECDPEFADTAVFCERYGYRLEDSGNTIVVASKRGEKKYSACVVRAPTGST